jgi:hypothetical protein
VFESMLFEGLSLMQISCFTSQYRIAEYRVPDRVNAKQELSDPQNKLLLEQHQIHGKAFGDYVVPATQDKNPLVHLMRGKKEGEKGLSSSEQFHMNGLLRTKAVYEHQVRQEVSNPEQVSLYHTFPVQSHPDGRADFSVWWAAIQNTVKSSPQTFLKALRNDPEVKQNPNASVAFWQAENRLLVGKDAERLQQWVASAPKEINAARNMAPEELLRASKPFDTLDHIKGTFSSWSGVVTKAEDAITDWTDELREIQSDLNQKPVTGNLSVQIDSKSRDHSTTYPDLWAYPLEKVRLMGKSKNDRASSI